ncbi:aspartate dehydrogenase domain-containing protein [Phytohabitans kaempferiae]|uniref:L-aspartate dehydrogenase n=1 Tax=Phytohabitans kaempferiae TaxID=1620943 RepID=A0ABV6MIR3_9ACTN
MTPLRQVGAPPSSDLRVVLLGLGAINRRVAQLVTDLLPNVRVVGSITRGGRPLDVALPPIRDAGQLAAVRADIVVEAAGHEALKTWGLPSVRSSRTLIISSVGALADDSFRQELERESAMCGSKVVLSPGAGAGVEALAAASTLGITSVIHRIVKSPEALGTIGVEDRKVVFAGTARQAAARYPRNANTVVTTALASAGLDETRVEIVADPAATRNSHEILAEGPAGRINARIDNVPIHSSPKSSEQAALAIVRLLRCAASPLVI